MAFLVGASCSSTIVSFDDMPRGRRNAGLPNQYRGHVCGKTMLMDILGERGVIKMTTKVMNINVGSESLVQKVRCTPSVGAFLATSGIPW